MSIGATPASVDPYAAKPWLAHYDAHVPASLTYSDKTYARVFAQNTAGLSQRVAIHYLGRAITYGQLDTLSNRFAHLLRARGLRPGDTVGVNLPNIPAYYAAIVGILKAGCVLSGVSPLLQPKELKYQLNDAGVKFLVTLDVLFDKAAAVIPQTGVKTVAVAGIGDFLPALKGFLGKLLKKIPRAGIHPIAGVAVDRFDTLLRPMPGAAIEGDDDCEAACLMQYTGGTTGPPKGAVLTQRNIVSHIQQVNTWLDIKPGAAHTLLSAFPLFHQAGLFLAMAILADGGTQVAVPNPRDLNFIISAMRKYKPGGVVNVPTIYLELLKQPRFRALDFSSVQWFVSGAAPFPPQYFKELESVVGEGKLVEVMGMTETSPVHTALPRYGRKKAGSVGLPISDTEVKLVDPASGNIVPVGEPGELIVRGPQVFTRGYHNKPDETASTLRDGWMHTGDVCTMDADGYFWVVDRVKDMVIVSGFKVFTRTVDDVLIEHAAIDTAATIGLPDPQRPGSEIVASAVVLNPGIAKSEQTKAEIMAYMRARVAPYKVPKVIEFMDELPLSPIGKVLKRKLREEIKFGSSPD